LVGIIIWKLSAQKKLAILNAALHNEDAERRSSPRIQLGRWFIPGLFSVAFALRAFFSLNNRESLSVITSMSSKTVSRVGMGL
jgi:hypothetical protein